MNEDYEPSDYEEMQEGIPPGAGVIHLPEKAGVPTVDQFLANLAEEATRTRYRAKIVIEDEHGRAIMYEYAPGYLHWGETVEFKATLGVSSS